MLTDITKRNELETRIQNWQLRTYAPPTFAEIMEMVDWLSEVCAAGEPLPVWAIGLRVLIGRIIRFENSQSKKVNA